MKIQVKDGPIIGYKHFTFPDGQPHIELAKEITNAEVTITTSIRTPDDLFLLCLVTDILECNENIVNLDLRYLMGGRMDNRIDNKQPYTLRVVGDILHQYNYDSIRVLDPHSDKTLKLIGGSCHPVAYYPDRELRTLFKLYDPRDTLVVAPDVGALDRIFKMFECAHVVYNVITCNKVRNQQTGEILRYKVDSYPEYIGGKRCLILDDICDGGATFKLCAKSLKEEYGARSVDLFVTHGLFTKGLPLEGIDNIYTTDSIYLPTNAQKNYGSQVEVL